MKAASAGGGIRGSGTLRIEPAPAQKIKKIKTCRVLAVVIVLAGPPRKSPEARGEGKGKTPGLSGDF